VRAPFAARNRREWQEWRSILIKFGYLYQQYVGSEWDTERSFTACGGST
jgi:hypothetical protein